MAAANLADLVRSAAASQSDKAALLDADRTLTWSELDLDVDSLAAALRAAGHDAGARIAIVLPNSIDFAVAYFGVLRGDLVAVPMNTGYTATELAYQLGDANVAAVITDLEHADVVTEAGSSEPIVVDAADGSWAALLASGADAGPVSSSSGGEDLAVLLYTSGTSGRPRGAMLSHRALLANLDQLDAIDPPVVASDDRVLLVLPLFHVYGLNSGLGLVAKVAATGVLVQRFDPVETLAVVRDEQVSALVGAPPMYVAWSMLPDLGESLSTVRLALSGAAPLAPAVLSAVLESSGHHIFEGYGLTETAPVVTTTLCSQIAKPGSVGKPLPGIELKLLVEADDDDDEVSGTDPGEIVVRGDNLFSGYWPDGAGGPDDDGWFRTGDIAYADADGDLFLVDRTRELILVSGFDVYPREVEDVLLQHPDVEEAAVIGIPHPYTGETVKALVVLRAGASLGPDTLIEFAAGRLARFKCPTTIEMVDELPHSLAGKVAKGRLRESLPSQ
jgi:long-chain acyl-CoA synthetase